MTDEPDYRHESIQHTYQTSKTLQQAIRIYFAVSTSPLLFSHNIVHGNVCLQPHPILVTLADGTEPPRQRTLSWPVSLG